MKSTKVHIYQASRQDIEGIIQVELDRYKELHDELGTEIDDLRRRFASRIKNIENWFLVAKHKENVVGSISAMPTNNKPETFISWEDSTNNGTCSLYKKNEHYQYLYIVNLDVKRDFTKHNVQYLLMAEMARMAIKKGYKTIYFESRMPNLRGWIIETIGENKWKGFTYERRLNEVEKYVEIKNQDNLPIDRLLRFYVKNGFKPLKVVADAFDDPESLNYGVVFYASIPYLPQSKVGRLIMSKIFGVVAKNQKLLSRVL